MCFRLNRDHRFFYFSEIKGVESFLPFSLDPSHIYIYTLNYKDKLPTFLTISLFSCPTNEFAYQYL